VDVADFSGWPRNPSCAIREFRRIPRPDIDRPEFVKQLTRFIRGGGHDTLVPTDDQTLMAMMEHYDDFKGMVQIACPPPEITRLILNKTLTLEIAQKCNIRVPSTTVISNSEQLSKLVGQLPFPWILKPAEKETREEETKSYTLATATEIALKFPTFREFKPSMLLQEYCPGEGVGVEMLMHKGNCLAVFQHRRLKELPHTGGVSVTAIAEMPNPALVDSSLSLLQAMRWEGVAMVEYKIDPSNGCAILMEVNGRYWGSISLPISAGVDFPLYHWQLMHGEQPQIPSTYAVGTKWRWTVGCLLRMHGLLAKARNSDVARQELSNSLRDLPKDLSPRVYDATFTFADPMPSIATFFRTLVYLSSCSLRFSRKP
jgi:predicted ATP-grasp superfamily ATP-dependent carboligase